MWEAHDDLVDNLKGSGVVLAKLVVLRLSRNKSKQPKERETTDLLKCYGFNPGLSHPERGHVKHLLPDTGVQSREGGIKWTEQNKRLTAVMLQETHNKLHCP